ncbi:hypothetical protein [Burkholderia gladioli]|uniref:hypothetical protein n=1 Tax=Burkholderia gladioli TaxID=28095 RepID=UPI001FC801E4|nr:hypothetical protein [Burkholderia gladioli]
MAPFGADPLDDRAHLVRQAILDQVVDIRGRRQVQLAARARDVHDPAVDLRAERQRAIGTQIGQPQVERADLGAISSDTHMQSSNKCDEWGAA